MTDPKIYSKEELIKLYNPANAAALTPEEVENMQNLTSAEIRELAEAYPNKTMQRAYLLIIDKTKPVEKQLPTLNSFENLYNLRERNGLRQYVAYGFKGTYKPRMISPGFTRPRKTEVVDLSDHELLTLPGFKKIVPMLTENGENDLQVQVSKIERIKKI
jgi:hypothetical protein